MEGGMEALVGENISKITHLTKNLPEILERLQDYDVFTSQEIGRIRFCENDLKRTELLYSFIARKPLSNFDLLLYVLKDTDNHSLAKLLEEWLRNGKARSASITSQKHTRSSTLPHKGDTECSTLIAGGEMGIAEILEEYYVLVEDWSKLSRMLSVPMPGRSSHKETDNYVILATYLLREWSLRLKRLATVDTLVRLLEKEDLHDCSERIRRMFYKYIDTGLVFDFPGSFSIVGKISSIASILENNPSFCLHPERLILLLDLPLETLEYRMNSDFFIFAERVLTRWAAEKPELASTDHLASLLAINGHFNTSERVSLL